MDILRPDEKDRIADLCCGHGAFCNDLPSEKNFYGCEIDENAVKVAQYLFPEANISCRDIREYAPGVHFDYIVGNPPFGLRWNFNGNEYVSECYYFLKSAELLKPGGIIAAIVPEAFCSDDFADQNIIGKLNENYRFIAQIRLDSKAFAHLGVASYRTKLLILQRQANALPKIPFRMDVMEERQSQRIYYDIILPLLVKKKELRAKLTLDEEKDEDIFLYKVKKLLYDIERHPVTKQYLIECKKIFDKISNPSASRKYGLRRMGRKENS